MLKFYVAATSQHVGKTTTTLGLIKAFGSQGFNVGYCKPVGQQALKYKDQFIDKDALLFANAMEFPLQAEIHSPVILGQGATTAFIDQPEKYNFREKLLHASRILETRHDAIIYEGTGHPGVGSVVGLSNAAVARLLDAKVILVVEGGIGSTIDEINMSSALFREQGVTIAGIIVNKIKADKLEKIRHYLEKFFKDNDPPILGYLPYDVSLANPIMESIARAIDGNVSHNPEKMDNRIEHVLPGSLLESVDFRKWQNVLLVSSSNRLAATMRKLIDIQRAQGLGNTLAGIIVTGDGTPDSHVDIPKQIEDYIMEHHIPLVSTLYDTYGSAVKINRIEVKINLKTPWKIALAEQMIQENVDFDKLFAVPVRPVH